MISLIIALLAGAALPLAFAPFNIYPLAFFTPAILFYLWLDDSPKKAFYHGFLFGLGFFIIGTSWVYISIHTYGNTSTTISIIITGLLMMLLALFPATQGYLIRKLFKSKTDTLFCLCIFPASWLVWEWIRTTLFFTGFPWLFLGDSQLTTPLRGFAPVFGVYGLSLIVAVMSGCLALLARRNSQQLKTIATVIIFGLVGCGWLLTLITWTKASGKSLSVTTIQGNIEQTIKWDRDHLMQTLQTYQSITSKNWGAQLMIWPEAAIPIFPNQAEFFINYMNQEAQQHHSYWLYGEPLIDEKNRYYNAMILGGIGQGQYLKRHLVPFGEYLPFSPIFSPMLNYLKIPMSDFTAGPADQPPIKIGDIAIAPFICYEIAFPIEVLNTTKNKNLIVVLVDDSWFDQSIALAQHLAMTQMRSLEMGRYSIQATNTGITAIINAKGHITANLPSAKMGVLKSQIVPMQGKTLLMIWNYYPVLIFTLGLILLAVFL